MQGAARSSVLAVFVAVVVAAVAPAVSAEPTEIEVRALSKGAKFIGSSMGGARITIRDAESDAILAQGVTRGSTGDTQRIMKSQAGRHAPIATEDAAVYRTTLDLDEPRRIEVEAYGPLAQPQAANRVSMTQWVVPGRDLTGGDGLTLTIPGFVVDVLAPPAHRQLTGTPLQVPLRANITMMCGCPVEPGGLWDSEQFEIAALLKRDGEPIGDGEAIPLEYAGQTSQFQLTVPLEAPGTYEATVYAHDPANGNTGVDKTTFVISEE